MKRREFITLLGGVAARSAGAAAVKAADHRLFRRRIKRDFHRPC
jgi:hypothetical protein